METASLGRHSHSDSWDTWGGQKKTISVEKTVRKDKLLRWGSSVHFVSVGEWLESKSVVSSSPLQKSVSCFSRNTVKSLNWRMFLFYLRFCVFSCAKFPPIKFSFIFHQMCAIPHTPARRWPARNHYIIVIVCVIENGSCNVKVVVVFFSVLVGAQTCDYVHTVWVTSHRNDNANINNPQNRQALGQQQMLHVVSSNTIRTSLINMRPGRHEKKNTRTHQTFESLSTSTKRSRSESWAHNSGLVIVN